MHGAQQNTMTAAYTKALKSDPVAPAKNTSQPTVPKNAQILKQIKNYSITINQLCKRTNAVAMKRARILPCVKMPINPMMAVKNSNKAKMKTITEPAMTAGGTVFLNIISTIATIVPQIGGT